MVIFKHAKWVNRRGENGAKAAFTLIEMLVVIAIVAVIFTTIAFTGNSTSFTNGAYSVMGIVQQAQSYATSHSTYVWVGFFEENPAVPGVAGQGQLVISVVASVDGTNLLSQLSAGQLPSASLIQQSQLMRIPNIHVNTGLSTNDIPNLLPANYQIDPTASSSSGAVTFAYPLLGTAQYKFQQIIQFSPQGDVSAIYGSPVQILQLGLIPAVGNQPLTNNKNVAAIQLYGIGGKAILNRP